MANFSLFGSTKSVLIIRLAVLGIFLFFPFLGNDYLIVQLTQYIIYGIFAIGLSLMWGYGGTLCFGSAVFFGLGAYVMALVTKGMVPVLEGPLTAGWIGLLLAVIVVALFAVTIGYFLFFGRLSGAYLAIVTLAFSVIAERIAVNWDYIGGYNGLTYIPGLSFAGWEITDPYVLFYLILAVGVSIYLFCDHVVRSPFGTIITAIRDNEIRAESFGYNIAYYKIGIFSIGAIVAGLAGAFFASVSEFVSPTILGFMLSTEVLVWVAVGGKEVLLAAFLGAIVVRILESFLSDLLTYYWLMILGLFFVTCVIFFPQGVFGNLFSERRKLQVSVK